MNRPRCSSFVPLQTQQLRLRSLIRIFGFNIKLIKNNNNCGDDDNTITHKNSNEGEIRPQLSSDEEPLVYYTLHHNKDNEAFYTSETLPLRHNPQKWADIYCPEVLKSNSMCIVVKIWLRSGRIKKLYKEQPQILEHEQTKPFLAESFEAEARSTTTILVTPSTERISALTKQLGKRSSIPSNLKRPPDKLLFTWGVNFSGLIVVSLQQADAKFRENSLLFQLNSDYFASPDHFTVDSLREQVSFNYQRLSESLPKRFPIPTAASNGDIRDELFINSPHVSRSSSPVLSRSNNPADVQQGLTSMSRTRYAEIFCMRSEVRKSYNLDTLLNIQELQRMHLQKMRECLELAADIKHQSMPCITIEELQRKRRTTSFSSPTSSAGYLSQHQYHHHHQSMGRKLSILLAENEVVEPQILLQAQILQKELESLRSRQRLLRNERETYSNRIAILRQRLVDLAAEKQVLEKNLAERNGLLRDDRNSVEASYQEKLVKMQERQKILQQTDKRIATLCLELRDIYPIDQNLSGFYTICGVPFPSIEAYVSDPKYASTISLEQHMSPLALSASFGYVAHILQMMSVIIDCPLRNPIVHEGSKSRIMTIIKDIPTGAREFPLYTRSTVPTKPLKYAIILLNQNIAQLCYDITGVHCDLRATIENLLHVFSTFLEIQHGNFSYNKRLLGGQVMRTRTHPNNRLLLSSDLNEQSLKKSESSTTNGPINVFEGTRHHIPNEVDGDLSKSHSSIDMHNAPQQPTVTTLSTIYLQSENNSSQPMPIIERNITIGNIAEEQRVSRSVGSYSDSEDGFKDINKHCYSNSDSNIVFHHGGGNGL